MLMDFITGINWIDILLVCVCARAVFIGFKTGFITEFFKTTGLLFSIFVTLNYYTTLTVLFAAQVTLFELPMVAILMFLALWGVTTYVFKLVREGLMMVFSVQAHPAVDRVGGLFLSCLRGVVVCGMVFYALLLSYSPDILRMAQSSWSRQVVSYLPTGIYAGIFNGFVVKFFPGEKISNEALLVPELLENKKAK